MYIFSVLVVAKVFKLALIYRQQDVISVDIHIEYHILKL